MAIADTARAQLRHLLESTWGTTPASPLVDLRMTSESLVYNIATTQSEEIRSDRQVTDLPQTEFNAGGGFQFELSYGEYDDLLTGVMQNTWVTGTDTGAGALGDHQYNSTTQLVTAPAGTFTGVVPGVVVKVAGAAANNNGYHTVTAVAGDGSTVTLAAGSLGTTEDSIASTITWAFLKNGTTARSWTLEKEYNDITQFQSFTGMRVNTFNLEMATQAIVTGGFEFLGKASSIASATVGTGSPTVSQTNDVMNAMSNITAITEGGTSITGVQSLSLNVNNNLRAQNQIGSTAAAGVGTGRFEVTGDLVAYFQDATLINKYINNTSTSINVTLQDASGKRYLVALPNVKYSGGEVVVGGANQDVLVNLTYQAIMDSTDSITMVINRFVS